MGRVDRGSLAAFVVALALLLGLVSTGTQHAPRLLQVAVAGALVWWCSRHVVGAVALLVAFLPFQQVLLSVLYRYGVPAAVVRPAGAIKDVVAVGLLLALARTWQVRRPAFDVADLAAAAYVTLATVYLVAPVFLTGVLADVSLTVRLLSWRTDVIFVLAFLALRHCLPVVRARDLRLPLAACLGAAALTASAAIFESLDPTAWNAFLEDTLRLRAYKTEILGVPPMGLDLLTHGSAGDADVIRPGSVLLSPTTLGFYLVPALGLALAGLAGRVSRVLPSLAVGLVASGIAVSLTRSAVLAGVVVGLTVLHLLVLTAASGRVRLGVILAVGGVLLTPVLLTSSLGDRTASSFGGEDESTSTHLVNFERGLEALVKEPIGRGLGTAAGVGDRFFVEGKLTSENAYLQVGNELGLLSMLLFVATLVLVVVRLRRAATAAPVEESDHLSAAGLYAAGVGLVLGGVFQQVWLDFTLSLTFWSLAGLVLARAARPAGQDDEVGMSSTSTTRPASDGSSPVAT